MALVLFEHIKIKLVNLFRQPAYIVGTLIFPGLFFLFFAAPNATDHDKANLLLGSFAAFAVIGVAFFQFGIDFAQERHSNWAKYLRTLPVSPLVFQAARMVVAGIVTVLAYITACVIVAATTPIDMSLGQWFSLTLALMLAMAPFSLLSLGLANYVSESAALPFFNLFYLILSYAGGLWMPPSALPEKVRQISEFLPTRAIGEVAWSITNKHELSLRWVIILVLTAFLGTGLFRLSTWLNRRN